MSASFDVIVIGMGGMGTAALYHLARRGQRVLGIEQFDLGHTNGSSHGVNRILRLSYFEGPAYVPMVQRALTLWRELEQFSGETVFVRTGALDAGPADHPIVAGSLVSSRTHNLAHEMLDARAVRTRFPAWQLPDDYVALFQPDGGFVLSERAIALYAQGALESGATLHAREKVLAIEPAAGHVSVRTDRGRYEAGQVIITAGAWVGTLLPALKKRTMPERRVIGWFAPKDRAKFRTTHCPVGIVPIADNQQYYVFPEYGVPGFKIGHHQHFREAVDPDTMPRVATARDEEHLRAGLRAIFPDADGPVLRMSACIYTMTADEHFIIDHAPDMPGVIVASPCSGHGFKFASAIGETLADMAMTGRSRFDLSMFTAQRPALAG
ncbi:MAG: N-methyl-L-tryptophan oxidase [Beijerinckiaceae bacterium]